MPINDEIARRRTFAIISHPDAGKTSLTEKFLLYGGAVQLAGSVTARKNHRATTSDWMELEKKRGISVSSTVLQFEYRGYAINLLDTPGHKDFSEDTYRVLTAVDAVVMVIDAGKGIETQTRKLFEICRRRHIPIFTFFNKLDRPAREPLALLDELESVLGIHAYAVNWPLGEGPGFRGVFDRLSQQLHLFQKTVSGAHRAPVSVMNLTDPAARQHLSEEVYQKAVEELEMLDGAGATFDRDAILRGELTPVFFGSAVNNFGVQLLLEAFLDYASEPGMRQSCGGPVPPNLEAFSGFVFKIQANMDPKHRDRLAFVRICSGRFTRDISVLHTRSGRRMRLSSSHKLFGRERETVDEAYAGDIIGIVGHSEFRIGDTLTEDAAIVYDEVPRFAPECFAYLHSTNSSQFKQFREGLEQLLQEGVMQMFRAPGFGGQNLPILAAVGPLQFEVVQYRLQSEYGAESRLERASWSVIRWIGPEVTQQTMDALTLPGGALLVRDLYDQAAILFPNDWTAKYFASRNAELPLSDIPFGTAATVMQVG